MLIMKLVDTEEGTSTEVTRNEVCVPTVNDWLDMLEGALCGLGYAKYKFNIEDDPDDEDNYDRVENDCDYEIPEKSNKKKK